MVDKVKLEEYFSVLTLKFTKKILAVENEEIVERLRRDKLSLLDKRRLSLLSSFQEKKTIVFVEFQDTKLQCKCS